MLAVVIIVYLSHNYNLETSSNVSYYCRYSLRSHTPGPGVSQLFWVLATGIQCHTIIKINNQNALIINIIV